MAPRSSGSDTAPPCVATGKVWTAVNFKTETGEPAKVTGPGMPQSGPSGVDCVAAFSGGLMVQAADTLLGGIGISGPRRGDADGA